MPAFDGMVTRCRAICSASRDLSKKSRLSSEPGRDETFAAAACHLLIRGEAVPRDITHDDIQWLSELANSKRLGLPGKIIPELYELALTSAGRKLPERQYTRT
jgi:hypothetical protein